MDNVTVLIKKDNPITVDEMIEMFGSSMPIEAVQLIWDAPDNMTIGECRAKLREIAAKRWRYG